MKKTLYKLKDGRTNLWKEWCNLLMTKHYDEAVVTIGEENLLSETCWLLTSADGDFVYYEHEEKKGHIKLPWSREHTINWPHFYLLNECLEYVCHGEEAEKRKNDFIGHSEV